jgi:hypothetical protein
MNTTQKGDITEQKFILYCLERNIPILKPIGNNLPYDFIIEHNNKLLKIQVKTCREKTSEVIVFNTRSCSKNYTEIVQDNYIGKIDYFATIYKDNCFFVPIEETKIGEQRIYIGETPKKNQHSYKEYFLF